MRFVTKAFRPRLPIPPLDAYPNLRRVVAEINFRRREFARPEIDLDALTVQNAEAIALHIETERMPEMLYRDDGMSFARAQVRDRVLRYAASELDTFLQHRLAV